MQGEGGIGYLGAECYKKSKEEQTQHPVVLMIQENCREVKAGIEEWKMKSKAFGVWDAYRHGKDFRFYSE